jgi:hypothetical protein
LLVTWVCELTSRELSGRFAQWLNDLANRPNGFASFDLRAKYLGARFNGAAAGWLVAERRCRPSLRSTQTRPASWLATLKAVLFGSVVMELQRRPGVVVA